MRQSDSPGVDSIISSSDVSLPYALGASELNKLRKLALSSHRRKFLGRFAVGGMEEDGFQAGRRPGITVIIPVYRDVSMTLDCIKSALPAIQAMPLSKLLIINDGSPDGGMVEALEEIARDFRGAVTVLHNDSNIGFVRTVNRGMKRCTTDDIVLLNNDTVLPDNWLSRLMADAYSNDQIATVTPLSNNTTICTFPDFLQDNELPFGLNVYEVDRAFAVDRLRCVDAPTGVGFCMYIRRSALDMVGLFDESRFGRGYGEENDFCQRAIALGLQNVITPNLFVLHRGGVSFGSERAPRIENAMKILATLYPKYHADVSRFVRADPLRHSRVHRLFRLIAMSSLPRVLHVCHNLGGGTEQHILELADALRVEAISLILQPSLDGNMLSLRLHASNHADFIVLDPSDKDTILRVLRALGISLVHYHHVMHVPSEYLSLGDDLEVPYVLTVHDFYLLAGNPTLTDDEGVYHPGNYDLLENSRYRRDGNMSAEAWRERYRHLVEDARFTIFPSQSAREVFSSGFRPRNAIVVSHPEMQRAIGVPFAGLAVKERYTIGVIGALSVEKGARLLDAVAGLAAQLHSNFDFVLIGYSAVHLGKVRSTGKYEVSDLPEIIREQSVDIFLFPALWPETYSYTLSYALQSGCAILAPEIGAFPERLAGRVGARLFSYLSTPAELVAVIEEFISDCICGADLPVVVGAAGHMSPAFYLEDYLKLAHEVSVSSDEAFDTSQLIVCGGERRSQTRLFDMAERIYQHPMMAWVDFVIPYGARRLIKRALMRLH